MAPSQILPSFAGFPSFLRAPMLQPQEVPPDAVVISGAPHDSTHTSRFGTRMGPKGIREGSLLTADRFLVAGAQGLIDPETGSRRFQPSPEGLVDVGDFTMSPTDVLKTTESIAQGVAQVVERGGFSVCLGGDHYVSYPSALGYCRAVAQREPGARLGYIHIDHHLDFGYDNPVWGKYNHGSNARRISEIDIISTQNMAWIGVPSGQSGEQVDTINRNGGAIFTSDDCHELGAAEVARRAADHAVRGCDAIYLTVDIDFIDTGFFPATGSVVNDAITPTQMIEILQVLSEYPIGALDLVEVSPRIDPSGRSMSISTEIVLTICTPRLFPDRGPV